MKVRKEHFLLPKAKNISTGTTKWIQSNRNPCELAKTLNCTSISSQPMVEGLPSTLITKIKPDMLLPNGDIIVSGHTGGPLIWQQQDGILRQALLNTEKDVKPEEKLNETMNVESCQNQSETCVISSVPASGGLLAITAVTPQQLTPIAASQVIKMNDYQVILSSETLPVSWQDNVKKNNTLPISSLPPIKPKTDAGFVISDQQMSFTSLGKMNVLSQNRFPRIMIKDGKSPLPANLAPSNISQTQLPSGKKSNKTGIKTIKPRRKPTQAKKIMLKPASSLLSQTALDYRNKDQIESQSNVVCVATSLPVPSTPLEKELSENVSTGIDYTIKSPAEPVALVTSTALPVSSSNIIITHENVHSFNTNLRPKSSEKTIPVASFTEKSNYSQILNSVKCSETNNMFDHSSVHLVEHTVTESSSILISSNSCITSQDQTITLNNTSVIGENVLIDSSTRVICSDEQTNLIHADVMAENNCNEQNREHTSNLIRSEEFPRDHTETILPLDIEHHEEHHTQEYTDNLLSQLSDSGVLPNISSSQISSVLNALVPSEKNSVNGLDHKKEPVKSEPTEFVKIENLQEIIRLRTKAADPKFRVCELNKQICFRCVNCMFLSLKTESVEKHWAEEHQSLRPDMLDKQVNKRSIKCLGCTNVLHSKYALQIHLLCDHNVITTEVHDLIGAMVTANRSQRDSKRHAGAKASKTKVSTQSTEGSKIISVSVPSSLNTTTYQTNITEGANTQVSNSVSTVTSYMETTTNCITEPTKVDEQKHVSDEVTELPTTPSFCLFSEIQLSSDREEIVITDYPCGEDDNKKIVTSKKRSRSPRRYRSIRNKMKSDFGLEMKYNYRCRAERCGVRVSSLVNLSYHLRCHKPESDLLYCPECEFSVVNWTSLTPHLWRKHNIDIDLYSCNLCSYKSNSYSKLINNHVKIHGDERPFLCDLCGKGFKTTKQLRNHKVIHRARRRYLGTGGRPDASESVDLAGTFTDYICTVCSRCFADSRILKHHTETVHNKARPYLCTFCSHTASSKSSLRMHIRQHTGEKPFSCNECEYITADHNSLRRHKMRHSGKRPYQCPHCAYNCIQATTYKSHLKNKHPGLDEGLMFSCPMCPFRTVKKDNYLAHKAEHDLGGDPRGRRKKPPLPSELVQVTLRENCIERFFEMDKHCEDVCLESRANILDEDTSPLLKTHLPEEHDVVVLLDHSNDITSIQDETIELSS